MHGTTPLQSPRNSVCQVNKFHPRRYVSRIKVFLQKRGYRGRVKRRRIGAISFLTIFIIRTERELFQAMKTTRLIAIHLNFCFLGSVWVQISFFSFFLSWVLLGMEIYYPGILNLWIIGWNKSTLRSSEQYHRIFIKIIDFGIIFCKNERIIKFIIRFFHTKSSILHYLYKKYKVAKSLIK